MGCAAPQVNCPTASTKLIATIPRPVAVLSGDTNSPIDCRAPMVIIRIAAAINMSGQGEMLTGSRETSFIQDSLRLR